MLQVSLRRLQIGQFEWNAMVEKCGNFDPRGPPGEGSDDGETGEKGWRRQELSPILRTRPWSRCLQTEGIELSLLNSVLSDCWRTYSVIKRASLCCLVGVTANLLQLIWLVQELSAPEMMKYYEIYCVAEVNSNKQRMFCLRRFKTDLSAGLSSC